MGFGNSRPLGAGNINDSGYKPKKQKFAKGHADAGPFKPSAPGQESLQSQSLKDGGNFANGRFPKKMSK